MITPRARSLALALLLALIPVESSPARAGERETARNDDPIERALRFESDGRLRPLWIAAPAARDAARSASPFVAEGPLDRAKRGPRPDFPEELWLERWQMLSSGDPTVGVQTLLEAKDRLVASDAVRRRTDALGALDAGLGTWEWMGPDNIGGRTPAIAFDPNNSNHLWVGTASGGIATSFDAGASWTMVDDFLPSLSVTSIVVNPNNGWLFASTGELAVGVTATGGGMNGAGVFRSTDNGVTWTQLPVTAGWTRVSRLAVVPGDGFLFAATSNGLYRSENWGDSWSLVLNETGLRDVEVTATSGLVLVGGSSDAFRSTDSGITWTTLTTGGTSALPATTGRVEIVIAPDQTTCFASLNLNQGEIWRSLDGGATWSRRNTGNNYLQAQGNYDNAIWVDPTNANVVVVGGIDAWRSNDGGATLTKISSWQNYPGPSAHADHHVIMSDPNYNGTTNRRVYFGNDGGVQRKEDILTGDTGWTDLSNGIRSTQFYRGAVLPSTGELMGGLQDNGTWRRTSGNNWVNRYGGDGGFCSYDASNGGQYFEYIQLEMHKNGIFDIPVQCTGGMTDVGNACTARFIAPFKADPVISGRVYAGGSSIWRSTNHADGWTMVRGPIGGLPNPIQGCGAPNARASAIELVSSSSQLVWVGYENGTLSRSTDDGATWVDVDDNGPTPPPDGRVVTDIAVNPSNTAEVWVTFGGFAGQAVWFTSDGGTTWSARVGSGSTALPSVPVEAIAIHPSNRSWIYAGTSLGVLASQDRGLTWGLMRSHERSEGPAYTQVSDLVWDGNRLVAFTYGRGVWRSGPLTSGPAGPALALLGSPLSGAQSGSVDWGDYDGDGDLDLIWTGNTAASDTLPLAPATRIARNAGAGAFSEIPVSLPHVAQGAARWGDYDGDGDLDLAITGMQSGGVSVARIYRNENGGFNDSFNSLEPVVLSDQAWGDLDNDGDLDLLVAGRGGPTYGHAGLTRVYLNDGGGFTPAAAALLGVRQASVDVGDVDNDGDLDLLVAGLQGATGGAVTKLYRNDGGATFTDVSAGLPAVDLSAEFGDYDEDGDLDLLLMGSSGLWVMRNNGGGALSTALVLNAQAEGMATWGDYDNDGDLDIAVNGRVGAADVTRLYRNDAGLHVDTGARLNGARRSALAWADCDNDGDVDLFQLGWASVANVAQVYRNDIATSNAIPNRPTGLTLNSSSCGNGRFQVTFSWNAGNDDRTATAALGYNLRIGTFPGGNDVMPSHTDTLFGGRRVAARGNVGARLSWTLSLPAGEYWWGVQSVDAATKGSVFANYGVARISTSYANVGTAFTNTTGTVAWGDADGDDDLDLLVTGVNGSDVWRNDGGGTFTPLGAGLPAVDYSSSAWGDYDGDGDLDILLTGCTPGSYVARIYRNNGGSFANVGASLVGACGGTAAWADWDRDGDLDPVITGFDGTNSSARLYLNDAGFFWDMGIPFTGVDQGESGWGDYDGDGDLDLVLTGRDDLAVRHTDLYRNDGSWFSAVSSGLPAVSFGSVAWADLNRDGLDDLVLAGSTGVGADQITRAYRSNGDGTFTDTFAGLPGMQEGSLDVADLDNDGRLDLLMTGYNPTVGRMTRAFLANASGSFLEAVGLGLPTVFSSDADLGDLDGDGILDVVLAGLAGPALTRVYRGCGALPNAAPGAPSGLTWSRNADQLTLSWNAAADDHATSGAGLGYNVRVGTTPGGQQIASAQSNVATGFHRVSAPGNARERLSVTLTVPDQRLYWSVQAVDPGRRAGAFAAEQTLGIQLQPVAQGIPGLHRSAIAWGDYDDDGDQDLVMCGSNGFGPLTKLYRNDAGAFVDAGAALPNVEWGSVDWGDYDRDGDLDLAICGWNAGPLVTRIYRNDGGTFTDLAAGLPGVIYGTVTWVDVENDGDLDLFVAGHDGTVGHGDIFIQRNGRFTLKYQVPGVWFSYADWGDFDEDGDMDLALMGHDGTQGTTRIFRNTWPTMTQVTTNALPGAWEGSLAWGDCDNDGDLDLLMNGWTGSYRFTEVFRNADNLLLPIGANIEGTSSSRSAWGDYDNDGDLDVAVTGYTDANVGMTRVYRKDAIGYVDANYNLPGTYYSSVAWGDLDNDHDLDLALTGWGGVGAVYLNDGAPPNQPPSAPGNLTSSVVGNLVTLTWTAASDDHTPPQSLSYNVRLGNSPGTGEIVSAMARADGWRKLDEWGNAQLRLSLPLTLAQTAGFWSVQAVDGAYQGGPFAAEIPTVVGAEAARVPDVDALAAVSPNPMRGVATIDLAIARSGHVEVDVYSVTGQRVARVHRGTMSAGYRQLRWEPRTESGNPLPPGVYLMRMSTESTKKTLKVVVAR